MSPSTTSDSGKIPCIKCKASNESDRTRCRTCGAHLYVMCKRCKHKVARFLETCATCQSPLHSDSKNKTGIADKIQRRAPQVIFVLILLVLLGYLFEIF